MARPLNDDGLRAQYIAEQESDQTEKRRGSRMADVLPFYDDGVSET